MVQTINMSVSLDITDAAVKLLPILRVYALFGQRRSLLILLCPFMIADVVIDTLLLFSSSAITSQGTDDEPFASCLVNAGLEWEIIIFILTLIKTAGHIMQSRKLGTHSIAEVVLHDGSLYFFTIFMIASLDSASGIAAIFPGTMSDTWNNICGMSGQFFDVLIPILIHHLFFNLRAFSDHTVQYSGKAPSNTTASPLSALDFAENRFLGNIGAPLDYNQWDNVDELENTGDGSISEWEILDNTVDPLTTLVPVIYDYEKGEAVRLVPIHKGGWSWSS
ncbi:hypothetical protein BDP27DRAFT_1401030 [Rhodocollybia butyracea]|uniref:Uncharacterized protein n=1 Tax=Rhodocollybia butyracea TaxID=206335 RepID=A0A9P5UAG3_9AGAR|nr:hypothetical protein BDP27DRAFT_1401030 [Rhodocollybia butyracea]